MSVCVCSCTFLQPLENYSFIGNAFVTGTMRNKYCATSETQAHDRDVSKNISKLIENMT